MFSNSAKLCLVAFSSLLGACAADSVVSQAAFDEEHAELGESEYIEAWTDQFGEPDLASETSARCVSTMPAHCLNQLENWQVTVTTGSMKYAGTDSKISMRVRFTRPDGTSAYSLWQGLNNGENNFERSDVDEFNVDYTNFGVPTRVEFRSNGAGDNEGWFLDSVDLVDTCSGGGWSANFDVWLEDGGALSAGRNLSCQ
jgi:hypothetical protein